MLSSYRAVVAALVLTVTAALAPTSSFAAIPLYGYDVVHTYPHDPRAFTEGLFYLDGYLFESTGLQGESRIRKERLETAEVLEERRVPPQYFGEGIVNWKKHLVSLTWQSQVGFVYDLATLRPERRFSYEGEGWALTQDGTQIYMSDGTADIRVLNPDTLLPTRRIHVTMDGRPVSRLNELEWVRGEIFANVWQTNWILRVDPRDGRVLGVINLAGILDRRDVVPGETDVLNGIAYDSAGDRLFVTGKNWPKLFEIKLKPAGFASFP